MSKLDKVSLWLDCHTVIIWVAATAVALNREQYLLALGISFITAFFAYSTVTRIMRVYLNAVISGLIAGVEHAVKSAEADR